MATNFNLTESIRVGERRAFHHQNANRIEAVDEEDLPFLSERGMILIACFVFCSLVWSTILLWLFG